MTLLVWQSASQECPQWGGEQSLLVPKLLCLAWTLEATETWSVLSLLSCALEWLQSWKESVELLFLVSSITLEGPLRLPC